MIFQLIQSIIVIFLRASLKHVQNACEIPVTLFRLLWRSIHGLVRESFLLSLIIEQILNEIIVQQKGMLLGLELSFVAGGS